MSQVNDAKRTALLTALVLTEGHIDDLEHQFLKTKTTIADDVNGMWMEYFTITGATSTNWNDAAQEFLTLKLVPAGHITDRWLYFWENIAP